MVMLTTRIFGLKHKLHRVNHHINIYLPFRNMISRRSVVTASKDIWEPQVLGVVGLGGLLSGIFVGEPKGDILESTTFVET